MLLAAAALQHSMLPYAALIIPMLVLFGLYEVQYATLVPHLYRPEERPRALGVRNFAVAAGTALLAALFGRFSSGAAGHTPVFLLAGLAMVAGGLVFRGVRPAGARPEASAAPRMPVLRAREIAGVMFGARSDTVTPAHRRKFRRLVLVLVLYGWYGARSRHHAGGGVRPGSASTNGGSGCWRQSPPWVRWFPHYWSPPGCGCSAAPPISACASAPA